MSRVSIKRRYQRISKMIDDNVPDSYGRLKKIRIIFDFMWEKITHNTYMSDYMQYEYYNKSKYCRRQFIDENRREIIHRTFNTPEDCEIFNRKEVFNEKFADYLLRDWIKVEDCTEEEFYAFIEKHKSFFVKPLDGWFGIGAGICDTTEYKDKKELWNKMRNEKSLLEECIIQHDEINEFNPSSVNTLRVVTLMLPDDSVKIVTADIRLGRKGKVADNFHHNGIAALIDIETGVTYTRGIDKTHKKYVVHPDSGKQIVGFKIPMWEEIKDTVVKAARVVPTVKYIGWDIAINKNGTISIVEGNCMADPDVTQMPDDKGKWFIYEPIINEYRRKEKQS